MQPAGSLLGPREVHVWFVELTANRASLDECLACLSADERERASRFRFEHLQNAFTQARGILRVLLGRYLAIHPDRMRFDYGARGKPRLAFPETNFEFNLAHSGRFAAYAFTTSCELGVDIEEIRQVPDQENIIRRFFSPEECADWLDLDSSQREEAFFRCWTRKEAYIKALGDGLSLPLDSFRVSLKPDVPASLIHAAPGHAAASEWTLTSLAPADGYTGALAFPQRSRAVHILPRRTTDEVLAD